MPGSQICGYILETKDKVNWRPVFPARKCYSELFVPGCASANCRYEHNKMKRNVVNMSDVVRSLAVSSMSLK